MLWAPLQQERFEKLGVLNTGERWLSMLLKRLMMTSWDMWSDRNDIKHGGHTLAARQEAVHDLQELIRQELALARHDRPCVLGTRACADES